MTVEKKPDTEDMSVAGILEANPYLDDATARYLLAAMSEAQTTFNAARKIDAPTVTITRLTLYRLMAWTAATLHLEHIGIENLQ